jgi:hypothetical protein
MLTQGVVEVAKRGVSVLTVSREFKMRRWECWKCRKSVRGLVRAKVGSERARQADYQRRSY